MDIPVSSSQSRRPAFPPAALSAVKSNLTADPLSLATLPALRQSEPNSQKSPAAERALPASHDLSPRRRRRLDRAVQWVINAYQRHFSLSAGGGLAALAALAGGTACASWLNRPGHPTASAMLIYLTSASIYYGVFMPLLVHHDRSSFINEETKLSFKKTWSKVKEYGGMIALTEIWFAPGGIGLMAAMMKLFHTTPTAAQVYSFAIMNGIYFGLLPLLKQGLESVFDERVAKQSL